MKFAEMASPFEGQGDRLWGCIVRGRYTFVIGYTPELGYSASWVDAWAPPAPAAFIIEGTPSYVQAERACKEQERRLRPN